MIALPFPNSICATCRHLRTSGNARGSIFMMCQRHKEQPEFPRYPPQPVRTCRGHETL